MRRLIALLVCLFIATGPAIAAANGGSSLDAGKKKKKQQEQEAITDPLYALTLMRQGSVMMQQGRVEEALTQFNEADKLAPGNATVYNMIGLCYMRLSEYDKALTAFDQAIRLIPGFTNARNNRGAIYLELGQYHMAEVDFIAVLGDSTYPHRKQVHYNLGMTYLQRDQFGAAGENFRKAIILPDPVFEAYLRLSEIAQRHGEMGSALDLLEEARFNFPDRLEGSLELGKLLLIMDREDEARPYLQQVVEDAPGSESAATARSLLGAI